MTALTLKTEPNFIWHMWCPNVSATHLAPGAAGLVPQLLKVGSLRSQAEPAQGEPVIWGGRAKGSEGGWGFMDHVV